MHLAFTPPENARRSAGVMVTLLLHLLLILAWQQARKGPPTDTGGPVATIQWVNILPPATLRAPARPPSRPPLVDVQPPPPAPPIRDAASTPAARPPAAQAPAAAALPTPVPAPAPAAAEAAPAPAAAPLSAYDMLQQAKRSVGKIDQDLRKTYPGQPITAPVSNGATRLAKGLQDAADAAPNKWYEAPKVTEILDPGPYGRRRYRVVGPLFTYCITVESNHAPDGIDQMQRGIQQKTTTCDEDEQAPTRQKYK